MHIVEIYTDIKGKSEIIDYINSIKDVTSKENKQILKKIYTYIDLLEEYGLALGEPYIKKIDNHIWELRPLKIRILFTDYFDNKFILLSIFKKKTRKTPKKEVEKAKRLLNGYIKEV